MTPTKTKTSLLLWLALAAPALADETTLTVANRQVIVHRPNGLKKPAPLLLLLHPFTMDGDWTLREFDVRTVSDEKGFIVAAPNGTADPSQRRFWNAAPACCDFRRTGVDDVAFLRAVLRAVRDRYPVDPHRIYAFGLSNGGFMAHRLACELPTVIAAIASNAGGGPPSCAGDSPVAVLEIHGDADRAVPITGGRLGEGLPPLADFPSLRQTLDGWAKRDGCSPAPERQRPMELDLLVSGPETTVDRWTGCRAGAVELWDIVGTGHVPDSPKLIFREAWEFLSRQSRK